MDYFTRAWALGDLSDDEADKVVRAYRDYLSALDRQSTVWRFASSVSLNDAWIENVEFEDGAISLRLLTGDLQRGYRHTALRYFGGRVTAGLDALKQAVTDRPTEIWYDEFAGAPPHIAHRFLLVNADGVHDRGEVHIAFDDFSFTETAAAGRVLGPR